MASHSEPVSVPAVKPDPTATNPQSAPALADPAPAAAKPGWLNARTKMGIVIGGSGQGEQLAANKVRGVRAALCNDLYTARMARQHNDANVLSIGGRVVGLGLAEEIVTLFLTTAFEGGRHARRVAMLADLEAEF